jgi:copper transport protein
VDLGRSVCSPVATRERAKRAVRRVGIALALSLLLLVALAGPVGAHAAIVLADPEPGSKLATAPGTVSLTFTEPLDVRLSRATVTDPTGQEFAGEPAERTITVPLATNAPGIYRVEWTTVSTLDGHTLRGSFEFGVGVEPANEAETIAGPGLADLAVAVARAVEYAALLLGVGLVLVRRLAVREPTTGVRLVPLRGVLAVAFIAGLGVIVGEAFMAAGSVSFEAVSTYLSGGWPGGARLARLGFEALAVSAASLRVWGPAAFLIGGAIVSVAAAGHAAALEPRWWGIAVDAVHLVAAGLWAGGILALATSRPEAGWRSEPAHRLLARFSAVAIPAFLVTVGSGIVQGFQEVGGLAGLGSSYGVVLLTKVALVLAMVPLSVLAWRRRIRPGAEAILGILVIGAAALLAAYPLPPARVAEAESLAASERPTAALPRGGDITLGGDAGRFLVGLTLRPGEPGPNEVLVYLKPPGEEAGGTPVWIAAAGQRHRMDECGPNCRRLRLSIEGRDEVRVIVGGPDGGVESFAIPALPPPDASILIERMQRRMHALRTYRLKEFLSSGLGTVIRSRYAFQAPDRMRIQVEGPNRSETVWIGRIRYIRRMDGEWQIQTSAPATQVPSFIWDSFQPFTAPRAVGESRVGGVPTTIVSFFGRSGDTPVWFRLWIDEGALVHQAEMRAEGHFMDHVYTDFDSPLTIRPPVEAEALEP